MNTPQKIVGIIGSYRKHGVIDSLVTEILDEAAKQGAETHKIYLTDYHLEFCTNCRSCLQQPGPERGKCVLKDDMESILDELDQADGFVLGSPVNFGNVTAITRLFLERCVCYGYWPWGEGPKTRHQKPTKKAILVSASGCPALLARFFLGAIDGLKRLATMLKARPVGVLRVGGVVNQKTELSGQTLRHARRLAHRLSG
ncbi:flavodoxin family protein [Spirulina subsalsa]|uniref:flavodoxin family protein n=1 Tax=Spirulina subsalsa TaxID=54311 RepID=UPI00031D7D29|nr:flavodoxin family protein [Spirulina subsalsa]